MNEVTRELREYREEAPEGCLECHEAYLDQLAAELEAELPVDTDQLAKALEDLQPDDGPDADLPF